MTGQRVLIGLIAKRTAQPTQTVLTVDGQVYDAEERDRQLVGALGLLLGLGSVECDVITPECAHDWVHDPLNGKHYRCRRCGRQTH